MTRPYGLVARGSSGRSSGAGASFVFIASLSLATTGCSSETSFSGEAPKTQRAALEGTCGDAQWDALSEECDVGGAGSLACSAECEATSFSVAADSVASESAESSGVFERRLNAAGAVAVGPLGAAVAVVQVEALPVTESGAASSTTTAHPRSVVMHGFNAQGTREFETVVASSADRVGESSGAVGESSLLTGSAQRWTPPLDTRPSLSALSNLGYFVSLPVLQADGAGNDPGDELDIGLVWLSSTGEIVGRRRAHDDAFSAQYAPSSVVLANGEVIVAWADDSGINTAPDLQYRRFSVVPQADNGAYDVSPSGAVEVLAASSGIESSPALSVWSDTWAAVYRLGQPNGLERVVVVAPDRQLQWVLPEGLPAMAGDQPALVPIDEDHLMLLYTVSLLVESDAGAPSAELNSPWVSVLRVALLDAASASPLNASGAELPGSGAMPGDFVPVCDLPGDGVAGYAATAAPASESVPWATSRLQPTAANLGGQGTFAWTTRGDNRSLANGEASGNDQVWRRSVGWNPTPTSCTDLTFGVATLLEAGDANDAESAAQTGPDRRAPALVAGYGREVAAWEDYTPPPDAEAALANPVSPDVRLRMVPVDTYCSPASPCAVGEGHCNTDADCVGSLKCGQHNGEAFGFRASLNVCISCGNGVVEQGEECDSSIETADCNANCTLAFCGDGRVHPSNEQCDTGQPGVDSAECTGQCVLSSCGDGYINLAASEACEPAVAGVSDAQCDFDCTLPACGDGVLNPFAGENCELTDPDCPAGCEVDEQMANCGPAGCPRVETRVTSVAPTDGEAHPVIRLVNEGDVSVDLNGYTLRYWFDEPQADGWIIDHFFNLGLMREELTQIGVPPNAIAGANHYVELQLEGTLPAATFQNGQLQSVGEGIFDFRWHHPSWSGLNEADDYSYPVERSNALMQQFLPNSRVTLYHQGVLVWGVEPGNASVCGNGIVEGAEACDDSGQSANCDANCTLAECGDGTVNTSAGEVCDPGLDSECLPDCSAVIAACSDANACLHVSVARFADDALNDQQVKLRLNVVNASGSSIALNRISVRYWLTKEPTGSWVVDCDYAQMSGGCANVNANAGALPVSPAVTGANLAWVIGFNATQSLAPGQSTGEIQLRAHSNPWAVFNEADDYSRPPSSNYAVSSVIGVYVDGSLVWGNAP